MGYNIPILFVCFKRFEAVKQSFECIRRVKPQKLYVVSDGARDDVEGEYEQVEACRTYIKAMIDWPCELHTDYRDENKGCGPGMYEAICWFFTQEEMGVVLEDDCVVQSSFFKFMEEMLIKYKDDSRIGLVAGFNGVENDICMPWSYCFSRYKATWGWGSWRRAWSQMDYHMNWRRSPLCESVIENMGFRSKDVRYWKHRIKLIDKQEVSAWDWQWFFSMACQHQLTIFPCVSLVSNVGFGEGATHTGIIWGRPKLAKADIQFPLIHPEYICPFVEFDRKYYRYNNSLYDTINRYVPLFIKHFVKRVLQISACSLLYLLL